MVRGFLRPLLLAYLMTAAVVWAQPNRLISETFSGQNGSRPAGWTVIGDPGPGFWTISENRVVSGDQSRLGKPEPLLLITTMPGADQWTDYFANVDFAFLGESGGVIVVARFVDKDNHYEAGVFSEGGKRYAKIDKISRGVRKTLARVEDSPSNPVPAFATHQAGGPLSQIIRMIVWGNEIGLQAGKGSQVFRMAANDPDPIPAGRVGFGVYGGSAIFDNMIVKNTPAEVFVKGSSNDPTVLADAPPATAQPNQTQASASGGGFSVQVGSNLPKDRAEALLRSLTDDGYDNAVITQIGNTFSVLLGAGLSRDQADALFQQLRAADYSPEAVVPAGGSVTAAAPTPALSQQQGSASVQTGGRVFRVLVFDEFADLAQANSARETLIRDNYTNVEVQETGGKYRVLIGRFPSAAEAELVVANLRRDDYAGARVIETTEDARVASTASPAQVLAQIDAMPELANLPPDQREKVRGLLLRAQAVGSGSASAREMLALREETKALTDELKLILQAYARGEEERRDKEGRVRDLYRLIDEALARGDLQEAERQMVAARMVYPDYAGHQFKEQRIRELRGGLSSSVNLVPQAAALSEDSMKQVNALLNEARQLKAGRHNAEALSRFQQVLQIDPSNREAQEEVRTLPAIIASDRLIQSGGGIQNYLLYGAVTAFVALFLVIGFVLIQNIRRERELIKQVSQMQEFVANQSSGRFPTIGSNPGFPTVTGTAPGLTPEQFAALQQGSAPPGSGIAPGLGGFPDLYSGLGAGVSGKASLQSSLAPTLPPPPMPATPERLTINESSTTVPLPFPGTPPTMGAGPLSDDVRLTPLGSAPSPRPEVSAAQRTPASPVPETPLPTAIELPPPPSVGVDAFAIPGLTPDSPTINLPPTPPTPVASAPAPDSKVGIHDLQTVFENPTESRSKPESSSQGFPPIPEIPGFPPPLPAQPTPTGFDSAIRGVTPMPPLAGNQDSSSLVVQSDPSRGVIFMQNFDDETAGEPPNGWQGEYDYATLTVDRAIAANDGGQSLKFEKRTGAGSANYVRKFPKASGQVRIEFDIRCDDKNKYLLGFYIEKDEDFKQSIHTIVHRMDSKSTPSLRVQGEPVPYEFGTWRHMVYELNLPAGTVSAYVDGEQVIKDARLPTAPSYVNTLSIRDNLATTGLLYLDNIIVTRM